MRKPFSSVPRFAAGCVVLVGLIGGLATSAAVAQTTTIDYSNVTTFSGDVYNNGGASGANSFTDLVADDITVTAGAAGAAVTGFQFTVGNLNAVSVTFTPIVDIFSADPTTGLPATLLFTQTFSPITEAASSVQIFNDFTTSTLFTVPANGKFWAGEVFTNTGISATSSAELNDIGEGIFSPPTIGTSQDLFFQSTAAESSQAGNPTGSVLFFGGSPVADFGYSFQTITPAAAAPEPTAGLLLLTALLPGGVAVYRRRRRR